MLSNNVLCQHHGSFCSSVNEGGRDGEMAVKVPSRVNVGDVNCRTRGSCSEVGVPCSKTQRFPLFFLAIGGRAGLICWLRGRSSHNHKCQA